MAGNCYPEGTADHVVTAVTAAAAGPIACSPEPILSLLNGFRRSKVLFAITSLNIPDLIAERGQPSLVTLARLLSASDDGLGRLLDAGVSLGLLDGNRTGYCLTQMAKTYLLKDSEYSLVGYISHSETFLYKLWGSLDTAVLTGHNCWHDVFGMDSSDVFASLYKEDASILRFMHGMHSFSKLSAHSVLTAFDLTPFKTLVDLGGATGALAVAACNLYPNMQAVVFDLPHVVNKAQKHFTAGAAVTAVKERLSWVTGDFFGQDQQFPAGDLYVLSRILHDWEEASCLKLLRLIHPRLPPGGALLICEMLLDESGTSPPEVLLQSLNMLTQTHGRERKLSEYSHLLETAGFTRIKGKRTGAYLDVVIAYKELSPMHNSI